MLSFAYEIEVIAPTAVNRIYATGPQIEHVLGGLIHPFPSDYRCLVRPITRAEYEAQHAEGKTTSAAMLVRMFQHAREHAANEAYVIAN